MTRRARAFRGELRRRLADAADADRAISMAKYMRGHFEFFGVATPERRRIMRAVEKGLDKPTDRDVVTFADAAWADPEREMQYVACDHLARHVKLLDRSTLGDIERLIRSRSWWDTADALASKVVGELVRAHLELVEVMDQWIDDDDFWIARTAILHQLAYKEGTDIDRLFRYCLKRADDEEFFIRKAIGWALRQYSWTDPDAIAAFVDEHRHQLSQLSVREATKRLA